MGQDFYSSEEYNYLEHHGILGMKWGKKNGPPYPLSDAKHDRIVEKYEKKRAKIARDPAKLKKYADKYNFTNEEIQEALKRMDTKREIDKRIPEKKKTLSAVKKQLAKNAATFEKHFDKFSEEEAELALKRLDVKQKAHEARLKEMRRPGDKFNITRDYLSSISSAVSSVAGISRGFKEFKENWSKVFGGYTLEESHVNWLDKHSKSSKAGSHDIDFLKKVLKDGKYTKAEIIDIVAKAKGVTKEEAEEWLNNPN